MKKENMIPYTSEDYTIPECKRQIKELKATGDYKKIIIWPGLPEVVNGKLISYGRVYITRNEAAQ